MHESLLIQRATQKQTQVFLRSEDKLIPPHEEEAIKSKIKLTKQKNLALKYTDDNN